ncbi:MAG TPA: DUF5713 family protein [Niastella sp.]
MAESYLKNEAIEGYKFVQGMWDNSYYPIHLVDAVYNSLYKLCYEIERTQPKDLEALCKITHATTDKINKLQVDFLDAGSQIDTFARECIAAEFEFIAASYGFKDAELEKLIATREW